MSAYEDLKNINFSLIGKECQLTGSFKFTGNTRITGSIEGEIEMLDESIISIDTNGCVKGKISCHDLEIYGHFDGDINSTGKVTIFPPARVEGTLKSQNLEVYSGALLNLDGFTQNLPS